MNANHDPNHPLEELLHDAPAPLQPNFKQDLRQRLMQAAVEKEMTMIHNTQGRGRTRPMELDIVAPLTRRLSLVAALAAVVILGAAILVVMQPSPEAGGNFAAMPDQQDASSPTVAPTVTVTPFPTRTPVDEAVDIEPTVTSTVHDAFGTATAIATIVPGVGPTIPPYDVPAACFTLADGGLVCNDGEVIFNGVTIGQIINDGGVEFVYDPAYMFPMGIETFFGGPIIQFSTTDIMPGTILNDFSDVISIVEVPNGFTVFDGMPAVAIGVGEMEDSSMIFSESVGVTSVIANGEAILPNYVIPGEDMAAARANLQAGEDMVFVRALPGVEDSRFAVTRDIGDEFTIEVTISDEGDLCTQDFGTVVTLGLDWFCNPFNHEDGATPTITRTYAVRVVGQSTNAVNQAVSILATDSSSAAELGWLFTRYPNVFTRITVVE